MLRNDDRAYGTIARTLHWTTAALFLAAYAAVYFRHWFTDRGTPANWTALQLHLSFGISIGVLTLLRVIWTLSNPRPAPEPGGRTAHLLAHGGHLALYAVMIGMPLTGYLGASVGTEFFFLFDIPKFEDTAAFRAVVERGLGLTFDAWEVPIDFVHKKGGAFVVWVLILGHAGAALYHHFVLRDRTLMKMAGTVG